MSPDGTKLLDEGRTVYTGPVAEGTKIHKINGYYYLSIQREEFPKDGKLFYAQKTLYGPYEKKVILEQGSTNINGPHQGAMVDTPYGEWFFFSFSTIQSIGQSGTFATYALEKWLASYRCRYGYEWHR